MPKTELTVGGVKTEPLPVVVLRDASELRRALFKEFDISGSERDYAQCLLLAPSTWKRVVDGSAEPGNRFIASVLDALPYTSFERWFEVRHQDIAA